MQIIAHRGLWQNPTNSHLNPHDSPIDSPSHDSPNLKAQNQKTQNLQNSLISFERALNSGFGIETDVRDCNKNIVISHDIPTLSATNVAQLFALYNKAHSTQTLALNIKADGLCKSLQNLITAHNITNYFCFDMSVPDMRHYARLGLKFFTRQSDIERDLPLYDEANGVWCDEFDESWISEKVILEHLQNGKKVAIVSPELHKREYQSAWNYYKQIIDLNALKGNSNILLCTDFPQIAKDFFK